LSGREFSIISSVSRVVEFSVFFVVVVVDVKSLEDLVVKLILVTTASSGSSVWVSGFFSLEFLLKMSMALSKASTI
jgi:hypothetical protein